MRLEDYFDGSQTKTELSQQVSQKEFKTKNYNDVKTV